MNERPPDFDELLGSDVPAEERERLERVHHMIISAGPLPELPLALQRSPAVEEERERSAAFSLLPRSVGRIMTLAAGFAAFALVIGYIIGRSHGGFESVESVPMRGTAAAPKADAVVKVGDRDANGNYPLEVTVTGLRPLPAKSYYVLYLVKGKRPAAICGSFLVRGNATTVRMSAPYDYRKYDGWTVAVYTIGKRKPGPTLLASGKAV